MVVYSSNSVDLSPQQFQQVRNIIVEAGKVEFCPPLRQLLDESLGIVVSSKYPKNAEEYFIFLKAFLENLQKELNEGTINEKSYAVLKSANKVFRALYESKAFANQNIYQAIINSLFPGLVGSWQILTRNLEEFVKAKHKNALEMNRKMDGLFIYMLLNAGEYPDCDVLQQSLCKLLDKAEQVLTLLKGAESWPKNNDYEDIYESLQKDAIVLLYDMTKIISTNPFAFSNLIKRVANFGFEALKLEWKDILITKCCLLLLFSVLRQFVFYVDNDYFKNSKMSGRLKNNTGLQTHCRTNYFEFFGRETFVQEFVSLMILKLMIKDEGDEKEKTIDTEIEDCEVTGIDHMKDELEVSLKRICVSVIEQLSIRVPNIMIPMLTFLIESVISGAMKDADLKTKDNIILLIGMLPGIYAKLGRKDVPNIDNFLQWFCNQSSQYTFFSRRFSMLLRQWIDFLSIETKMKYFPALVELMNHKDLITRYSTLRTISEFVEKDTSVQLNYTMIHDLIAPAIVQMCEHVSIPHLIWPLLKTLSLVMERVQGQNSFVPFKHIQNMNFKKLLQKDDATVRHGMIEVFRKIIVAVPFGSPIHYAFEAAYDFLCLIVPKIEAGETEELTFWKFIIKEYSPTSENQALTKKYADLLQQYYPRFSNFTDPGQICEALAIVDEYYLLLKELPFNFIEYLNKYLDFSNTLQNLEDSIQVKSRALTLYTTAILFSMQFGNVNFADFEKCIGACCDGIMADLDSKGAGPIVDFKTQAVSIFSRFFLMKPAEMSAYVSSKINIKLFLKAWLKSTSMITSKKSTRINSFAMLTALTHLPIEMTLEDMPRLLEHTFTDIIGEIEVHKTEKPSSMTLQQKRLGHFSHRKEEIRKVQLYEDQSLLKYFKDTMKTIQQNLASKGLNFPNVDAKFQEKAHYLMNYGGA